MLPSYTLLRQRLKANIANKHQQGFDTSGLDRELQATADNYESLNEFALKLNNLLIRDDWEYVEPDDLEGILTQCNLPNRATEEAWLSKIPHDTQHRVAHAFKASICGCILGKPIEVNPTLQTLRTAGEAVSEWPINDI